MSDYALMPGKRCEACSADGDHTPLKMTTPDPKSERVRETQNSDPYPLCDLCRDTLAGNMPDWPSNYAHPVSASEMYQHVNEALNNVLYRIQEMLKEQRET